MLLQSSINTDPLSPSTILPLDPKQTVTKNASLLSTARRKDMEKGNDHLDLDNQDLVSTLPIDIHLPSTLTIHIIQSIGLLGRDGSLQPFTGGLEVSSFSWDEITDLVKCYRGCKISQPKLDIFSHFAFHALGR